MKLVFGVILLIACATAGFVRPLLRLRPWSEMESRITNGDLATRGQFPYQVGLSLKFDKQGAWCGGTLVSDVWIVTAAHCTDGADSVLVYLGAQKINLEDEEGQQRVQVSKSGIYTHEGYDASTISNDIALIKLPAPVEFTKYIQPAVLPKKSGSYSTYVNEDVVASGWGLVSDSASSVSEELNYIDSTVISKSKCSPYYLGMIKDSNICISGKNGRSICSGDSGGPLIIKEGGENVLIGATSFGISLGCEKGWPGVFTRITSYLDWIDAKTDIVN